MKVAVVGATGLVGTRMLEILEERNFPVSEIIAVASEKSAGSKLNFKGKDVIVCCPEDAIPQKPSLALFSAGGNTSIQWAPLFAGAGIRVIDNSSAWRMKPEIPLVVPEINADVITEKDLIIANPNCSTIQMVMVLNPLHKIYKIKRVVVSTYQSVSGTGAKAVDQLMSERQGKVSPQAYPHPIDLNVIPHIDSFSDDGYTKEEIKMMNETRKIMRDDSLAVTATTVRVPVLAGHSESVNIEFENDFKIEDIRNLFLTIPGVTLQDEPDAFVYPMPLYSEGKDDVFVGRIRRDNSRANCLNLWIVSDNLRKGAATNAVQIAEYLLEKKFI